MSYYTYNIKQTQLRQTFLDAQDTRDSVGVCRRVRKHLGRLPRKIVFVTSLDYTLCKRSSREQSDGSAVGTQSIEI